MKHTILVCLFSATLLGCGASEDTEENGFAATSASQRAVQEKRISSREAQPPASSTAEHPAIARFTSWRKAVLAADIAEMKKYMGPKLSADFDAGELDVESCHSLIKTHATWRTGIFLGNLVIIPSDHAGVELMAWTMKEIGGKWVLAE